MSRYNRLKEILDSQGIKQVWLAEKAGIKTSTLSELVSQKREPTLETARKIAKVLRIPIEDIWPE